MLEFLSVTVMARQVEQRQKFHLKTQMKHVTASNL
jgi:hypothetical protein